MLPLSRQFGMLGRMSRNPHEYALWINMPWGKSSYLFQLISSWPDKWKGQKFQTVPCNHVLKSFYLIFSHGNDYRNNTRTFHCVFICQAEVQTKPPQDIFALKCIFHANLFKWWKSYFLQPCFFSFVFQMRVVQLLSIIAGLKLYLLIPCWLVGLWAWQCFKDYLLHTGIPAIFTPHKS